MTNNEFQGNPESGIDRFLNESAQAEQSPIELSPGDQVAELQAELSDIRNQNTYLRDKVAEMQAKIDKAETAFKAVLDGDIDAAQTAEDFSEVINLLGWDINQEIKVEVTATWFGTIKVPYGTDLADVSLSFETPTADEDGVELDLGWHVDDYTVEER